ncbi:MULTISPECIES: cation:proton antiporter [Tissierella]|uniref:cation:proton antiporter n=1 Tax=Tissierella TaxID=41273 RepID=UPI001C0FFEB7|nr:MULTISPECIES: cation:proton antiporter [Tissierella]MBU5257336.1 cation:proton antiporter [Tissierella praeacuta]
MATSLAIIIILGLMANAIFTRIKLPGLLGMIIVGILIGPYGLKWLSEDIIRVSADFRKIALIIILLRAGFGISKEDLKKVGAPAIRLSCIPGLFEGFAIATMSMNIFEFNFVQGGILGFIIAAVSPAVIVPAMLNFMERGLGEDKGIPTLILAGASIDDVFAITIFSTFLGIYSGSKINIGMRILSIPVSIILGVLVGAVIGVLLVRFFKKYSIRDTKKVLYIIGAGILLAAFEDLIKSKIEIAGLLGVMTIGFIVLETMPDVGKGMAVKLNKIWVFAEILLFVLVGAQVNIWLALDAGLRGILLIVIGLFARSIGVILSLVKTNLNIKEKIFCIIAYIPKATVQAAIGGIPLSLGVESGDLILSIAVLSIVLTAPVGAIGISLSGEKLLS